MPQEREATLREWGNRLWPTLLILAMLLGMIKGAAYLGWLPKPAIGWNSEMAVIEHQLRSAKDSAPADILLLGDSTCLAGVDALGLSEQLSSRPEVRSLALYIWLDFTVYAELMSQHTEQHPGKTHTIILLVSALKLSGDSPQSDGEKIWQDAKLWSEGSSSKEEFVSDRSGVQALKRQALSWVLQRPLGGSGSASFGFPGEIDKFMRIHKGSVPTLGIATPSRPPVTEPGKEYVLSLSSRTNSVLFRQKLPPGAKLIVGITPNMRSYCPPNERERRDALLKAWAAVIGADVVLTNLPATLPDVLFSQGAHLNQQGQKVYTKILAKGISSLCPIVTRE